ncbi:MAG: competence/damage-inducible protein A [Deltaproteobacteria bacterium]|nr:competence/damage-inducible protein A [Deltaproteobacteria bacterium]
MSVALLSIGTELLQGEIANSNAQWIGDALTALGFHVTRIECVGDERDVLAATLSRLVDEHAFVIATGGLGPTSDDLTAEVAASVFGTMLALDDDQLATMRRKLEKVGRTLRQGHVKQANLPVGCEVLANPVGSAPGFALARGDHEVVFLPGVPAEMKAMFEQGVAPRLARRLTSDEHRVVLHTYGAGESIVAERLEGLEASFPGVVLGYRIKGTEVDVKVVARAASRADARVLAEQAADEARDRLDELVYGEGDETLVQVVARSLRSRGFTLAVSESCTGGLVAKELTALPASDYFAGGTVTYSNAAKTKLLGVSEDTLRGHGAVSAEVAAEMAEGARRSFGTDVALSVTGIAGPTGATADKPVGLVYWAVAHPGGTVVSHRIFSGTRGQIQLAATYAVLDEVRRACASLRLSRSSARGLSG